MKKLLVFAVIVFAVVSTSQASIIRTVSATAIATSFVGSSGMLTMSDNTSIDVENTSGVITTYKNGSFSLNTTLVSDNSVGAMANGSFFGGTFSYIDSGNVVLLSGNIGFFDVEEVFNGSGPIYCYRRKFAGGVRFLR